MTNIVHVQELLKTGIETSKKTMSKFKEELEGNPAYAFEWGYAAVQAASKLRLYSWILSLLSKDVELDKIIKILEDKFNHPNLLNSTNPLSNLVSLSEHQETIKLWTEIKERSSWK